MKHFWFVLGLLESGSGGFFLQSWDRSTDNDELVLQYLQRFINWLPEMTAISDNLFHSVSGLVDDNSFDLLWAHQIISLGYQIGWDVSNDTVRDNYEGNIVEALLDHGAIEEHEGRYRVCNC